MDSSKLKKIRNLCLSTLSWLRDHSVPPTPLYYTVVYEALSKSNIALAKELSKLDTKSLDFHQSLELLYEQHCSSADEKNAEVSYHLISELIENSILSLSNTQYTLNNYTNSLSESKVQLAGNKTNDIINIVSDLIEETVAVKKHSRTLEEELLNTNNKLASIKDEYLTVKSQSHKDPLTQVLNRAGLDKAIKSIVPYEQCYPISVLMADIDFFKNFNDTHGHMLGDSILRLVSHTLSSSIKDSDIIARYGGEEFIIILLNTDKKSGVSVAERLRKKIEALVSSDSRSENGTQLNKITLSIGVSELLFDQNFSQALSKADEALYRCKSEGRNCVRN